MSTIPASQIVDVTPNVLGAGGNALDLIGLLLTNGTRVPIGTVASFATSDAVSAYFGGSSTEAALAGVYFSGFGNSNVKPGAVLFAQYPKTAASAFMRGASVAALTLAQLQAVAGTLSITVDGYARNDSGGSLDLSGATSFSDAASKIATFLNASLPTEASVTGAISGNTLTVSAVGSGTLAVGQTVLGSGVASNTIITALGTGTGGTGTYTVSQSQSVGSEALTTQPTHVAVTYDSVSGGFLVTSGVSGVASTIGYATGAAAAGLKLTSATGAVLSQGAAAAVPGTFMDGIVAVTQNWATFMTTFNPDDSGNANKLLFSAWANGKGNRFGYIGWDTDASPTTQNPASSSFGQEVIANNYSGTCTIWTPTDATKAAFICGAIASIDFEELDGRATLAFKSQSGLAADVSDVTVASNLLANGYNFYGVYATANQDFTFFNPGKISGNFIWLDSFVNQIWMTNAFQLALMSLLTTVKSIPYNSGGYALIEAALLDPINAALNFGAIRSGVTLSAAQIAEVNAAAGKSIADTIQTQGWYLQILDATAQVRAQRGSPPSKFWYTDGESVQSIDLTSVTIQ